MCAHKTYISLWVKNGSKVFDVLIQLITKSMDNLTRSGVFQNIKHILDEQFFPFPSNCAHPTIISYLVVSIVFISRLLVYNIAYYYYITTQVVYTLFLFSLLFQLLVAGMQKLDYSSTRGLAKCHGIWLDILQVIMLPCSQESFFL